MPLLSPLSSILNVLGNTKLANATPPPVTFPILDSVNRADNNLSPGQTESPIYNYLIHDANIDGVSEAVFGVSNHRIYWMGGGITIPVLSLEIGQSNKIALSANLKVDNFSNGVAFVIRYKPVDSNLPTNGIFLDYDGANEILLLTERVEYGYNVLASLPISAGTHDFELNADGTTVNVWLDDVLVMTETTTLLTGTQLGFLFSTVGDNYGINDIGVDINF